ncbi:MAG: YajQ family cyclic di-GMP-binding protein [Methylophilaceae bacterium]|nr:MAG: YajQ family cyclic di-GMP-binding protein [Methylophilaceae bacterium]
MPSFDITSEVDKVALSNSIDTASKQITNRYDFKGTSAKVEFNEKDFVITVYGENDFQLDQIKDILLPAMEKKEPDSAKRLEHKDVQTVAGSKVKQDLVVRDGIDSDLAKKIVRTIKDSRMKVQASIQGESVRVNGGKRDLLQDAIALVKKNITDFPLKFGNFRD